MSQNKYFCECRSQPRQIAHSLVLEDATNLSVNHQLSVYTGESNRCYSYCSSQANHSGKMVTVNGCLSWYRRLCRCHGSLHFSVFARATSSTEYINQDICLWLKHPFANAWTVSLTTQLQRQDTHRDFLCIWQDSSSCHKLPDCRVDRQTHFQDKYPEVFPGIRMLNGHQVKLHIDTSVQPVAQSHRRIPFHIRKLVEKELEELKGEDIIERFEGPTPWVSLIVVAPKPKQPGKIRVRVDVRRPNQAVKRDRPLTPTVDIIAGQQQQHRNYLAMCFLYMASQLTKTICSNQTDHSSSNPEEVRSFLGLVTYCDLLFNSRPGHHDTAPLRAHKERPTVGVDLTTSVCIWLIKKHSAVTQSWPTLIKQKTQIAVDADPNGSWCSLIPDWLGRKNARSLIQVKHCHLWSNDTHRRKGRHWPLSRVAFIFRSISSDTPSL